MADEEHAPAQGDEKKKKGLPPFVLPLVLFFAGFGGGGFVGAKVVGPKLTTGFMGNISQADLDAHAKKKKKNAEEHGEDGEDAEGEEGEAGDEEHGDEGGEAKGGGEHGPAAKPPVYTIGDLVLNPAGSGGTRFLMMSVALDMKDSVAVEALKARDAEIKDAVLALVGGKTVEELAEVSSREPLKVEIRETIGRITKKPKQIKRVSFPQFVIQ
jgi:flagellar protein FliL